MNFCTKTWLRRKWKCNKGASKRKRGIKKFKEPKKTEEVKQVTEILKYIISQNFEATFLLLNLFSSTKKFLYTTLNYCKVRLGNITVYWVDNYSPILLWHCRSTCTRVWLKNTSIFAYILWKSTAMENRKKLKQ